MGVVFFGIIGVSAFSITGDSEAGLFPKCFPQGVIHNEVILDIISSDDNKSE